MKNTTLPVLLGGISVIVLILVLIFTGGKDKTGPVIEFTDECITVFTDDDEADILLEGVKAVDKKDGDVSSTLRIQNITVLLDEGKIVVHYSAKDVDNNIVKAEKIYEYTGTKEFIDFSLLDEDIFEDNNEVEGSTSETQSSSETTTPNNPTSSSETTSNNEPTTDETTSVNNPVQDETTTQNPNNQGNDTPIDKAEVDATGIPQIRMKYHEKKIAVGGDFYFMDALAEWYDDKDDVSRRVILVGEYDVNVPGTYVLTYYVTDSDLNVSNKETLTLIVE